MLSIVGHMCRTLEMYVGSYTDCINLHTKGGQCNNGSGAALGLNTRPYGDRSN